MVGRDRQSLPDRQGFLDRVDERAVLDGLIAAVRGGESRALVLQGDPGVGKTALLDYAARSATGFRVLRGAGVQSEMELAFAGLHQLCVPLLDGLPQRLPAPQRAALGTAFGLAEGPPPDRFMVSLAALGLLSEGARERPLICLVDDAQWLDSASAETFGFVARRIRAESVAMVFAVRDPHPVEALTALDQLTLAGLREHDAYTLFRTFHRGPVDERVAHRVVAEARGNPLALLELPRGFTDAELAGGFGPPAAATLPGRIEESFLRQLAPLRPDTRRLLLLAAADPAGDPVLLWRSAERSGIGVHAAEPAAAAGLVDFGTPVRFRHPLLRSAIYRAASASERAAAHRALAQATDPDTDPDRRAWHEAHAATSPDEDVAAHLEQSADRAQARGGPTAAAAFLERAVELTPEPARRGERALAAAAARLQAGQPDAALRLLALAEAGPLDKLQEARAGLLRGQVAFARQRGADAVTLLLHAARRLEPLDIRLARDTYLEAVTAALFAADMATRDGIQDVAAAARVAPSAPPPPTAADLLLDGLAVRFTDGYTAGAPLLKVAVDAYRSRDLSREEQLNLPWFLLISVAAGLWDDETFEVLVRRFLQLARDAGALALLPLALTANISWHIFAGELAEAEALLEEQEALSAATETPLGTYGNVAFAAWRGREAEAFELINTAFQKNMRRGEGNGVIVTLWYKAVLCNSLGRFEDALAAAQQVTASTADTGIPKWSSLIELITATVHLGDRDRATDAFRQLTEMTQAAGTDWALGMEAFARAQLNDGETAEASHREAIDRLARTRIRGQLALAHLVYGEWLRRHNRRADAREQLRTAHQMFTTMGMEAFARRAATELLATGETVRKRTMEPTGHLTAQEAQISRLVGQGLTNAEIATRLFLSPRTIEWHLGNIYTKLGISNRRQLREKLPLP